MMNLKALAMGAAVGFLVALSPSCTPRTTTTCSAANCAGCCDSAGVCKTTPSVTACGVGGSVCQACTAGQECVSGACKAAPSDAGVACGPGSVNNPCTTGCCSGSVCMMGTKTTNCGKGGEVCKACDTTAGETCVEQVCTAADAGTTSAVGKACASDTECAALGAGAVCRLTTGTDAGVYAEGYCTKVCGAAGTSCPSGSICTGLGAALDETKPLCLATCQNKNQAPGDCRDGYACYGLTGANVCWIYPPPEVDAGPPADKVGDDCAQDSDCQNPPANGGFCFSETFDGGPTGFVQGYCSAECTEDPSVCSADGGAICITFGTGTPGQEISLCQRVCNGPTTGQGDCKSGYVCEGYTERLADGGTQPSATGICRPSCANPGAGCPAGLTCDGLGYCK